MERLHNAPLFSVVLYLLLLGAALHEAESFDLDPHFPDFFCPDDGTHAEEEIRGPELSNVGTQQFSRSFPREDDPGAQPQPLPDNQIFDTGAKEDPGQPELGNAGTDRQSRIRPRHRPHHRPHRPTHPRPPPDDDNPQRQPDNDNDPAHREAFSDVEGRGQWELFKEDAGVSAMHMVINHHNKAIFYDSAIYQPSNLKLPEGMPCRKQPNAQHGEVDCWAHAAELDTVTGALRPLKVVTDTWCSSGGISPNGTLVQTGGWKDGGRGVRYLDTCDTCDFVEFPTDLSGERWYSTQLKLPDGNFVLIGGRQMFSFEFVPPPGRGNTKSINFPFLAETNDKVENNLYPFVYLNTDGNIFIFANNRAILFELMTGKVIRQYPTLPGGSRNYPSSAMSALLPIDLNTPGEAGDAKIPAEVIICGGSVPEAFEVASKGKFPDALKTCGRISVNKPNDTWHIEEMPIGRTMGDMLLLPNTEILIINGASKGCSGWDFAREPVLEPLLYRPFLDPSINRFATLNGSQIPRMYHSVSAVLQDASILVGGSNTNSKYMFKDVLFPTEVRMEKFYPPYFDQRLDRFRPTIVEDTVPQTADHGQNFELQFTTTNNASNVQMDEVMLTLYSPPFTTHGFSMNQRLLVLKIEEVSVRLAGRVNVEASMPPSGEVAPPGYYMLFAVYRGVPGKAVWIQLM